MHTAQLHTLRMVDSRSLWRN